MNIKELSPTEEHYTALGKITAYSASLDATIAGCIQDLISRESDVVLTILTTGLPFRLKLAMLSSIHKQKVVDEGKQAELKALLDRADEARKERNAATHAEWIGGRKKGTITSISARASRKQGFQFQFEVKSVKDLMALAKRIDKLADEIFYFFFR